MEEDMRYAHCDGHSDICYDDLGETIITGGGDGDIRVWKGFEDDDPESHSMGVSVSAIAFHDDMVYVASDSFIVKSYVFPAIEFEQIVAQFNTAVHHIVVSKDGKYVASGGGDFIIKVFNTDDKSLVAFRGHDGPILSIAFDPQGKYLASSGCDGTVRIWNFEDQECKKVFNLFKKSNDLCPTSTLCRLEWSSDGKYLAVPVDTKIHFYERDNWLAPNYYLTDECIKETISIVTFSHFGKYVAAATLNGQIIVWDMNKKCLSRKLHQKKLGICGLKWHPNEKELVFIDIEGQMGLYENATQTKLDKSNFVDDMAEEDGTKDSMEEEVADDVATKSDTDFLDDNDFGNDNAFDIGAIKASYEPKIFGTDLEDNFDIAPKEPEPKIKVVEAPKAPVQTAFQPSSTPVHLEHRFMLWNTVGVVRSYNTEEENSIDVEFHDADIYHPLHLNNTRCHTMASLSTEGLLLACPKIDGNTSKLECTHFGSWDSSKDWLVDMSEDEEIEAITLGDGFAVCITDKRYVRLFTISGVQFELFLLPGPVVCCSAQNDQLLIVYHNGPGINNDQNLNIMLAKVKLGKHCHIKEFSVPLSSKSFLSWLGHTDEGKPCIVDTSGVLSILSTSCGGKWIPACETNANMKGRPDTYFVIGLSEIKQEIRCILCKGSRYPSLLPKPTLSVIPFCLPFCEMSTDKGRLEEENYRYSLTHKTLESLLKNKYEVDSEFKSNEKRWMDVLLKMFALATRSDREYRAYNIAELMPNTVVIQGAIKYATQRHRIALAERLGEVMSDKMAADDEDEEIVDEEPEMEFSESLLSKNSTFNSTMNDEVVLKPKPLLRVKSNTDRFMELDGSSDSASLSEPILPAGSTTSAKSSPITNPFKSGSKIPSSKLDATKQNGIDGVLNDSMKNLSGSARASGSGALNTVKKPRFSFSKENSKASTSGNKQTTNGVKPENKQGFNLFLEENKETIKSTASSEQLSEKEIIKEAMKLYKELPADEKKKYQKGKQNSECKPVKNDDIHEEADCPSENVSDEMMDLDQNSKTSNGTSVKRSEITNDSSSEIPKPKKLKLVQEKPAEKTFKKLTQFAFTKASSRP